MMSCCGGKRTPSVQIRIVVGLGLYCPVRVTPTTVMVMRALAEGDKPPPYVKRPTPQPSAFGTQAVPGEGIRQTPSFCFQLSTISYGLSMGLDPSRIIDSHSCWKWNVRCPFLTKASRRETSPLRTDKDRRRAGALLPCKGNPSRRFGYARVKRREQNPLRT